MWIVPSTSTAVKSPLEVNGSSIIQCCTDTTKQFFLPRWAWRTAVRGWWRWCPSLAFQACWSHQGTPEENRKNSAVRAWEPILFPSYKAQQQSCVCPAPHQWELWGPSSCSHHTKLKMVRTRQLKNTPEKKANSGTSSLPSTRTPQSQTPSMLQWLDNFRCLGGLTHCTSGCPGLVSLLQPQQLNHLRDKEVQKQINSRSFS